MISTHHKITLPLNLFLLYINPLISKDGLSRVGHGLSRVGPSYPHVTLLSQNFMRMLRLWNNGNIRVFSFILGEDREGSDIICDVLAIPQHTNRVGIPWPYLVSRVLDLLSSVAKSCPALCDPTGRSTPGSPGLDTFHTVTSVDWNKSTRRESCDSQLCLGTSWMLESRDSLPGSSEELLQRGRGRDQHTSDFWEGVCAITHESVWQVAARYKA